MDFATAPYKLLIRHRQILFTTTVNEIRQRYAGSAAGLLWVVLAPLLLMSLYAAIYLLIFRVQPGKLSAGEYVLYIFSGLIPFLGFMEALNQGSSALVTNKAVLLNTVFPAELLPLKAVLASQGTTMVGLAVTVAVAMALGKISWILLTLPLIWLALVMFVAGLVWILSLVTLVMRDVQQVLVFVSMSLLIVTPIAYTTDMVSGAMRLVIYLNPLSYFTIAFHDIVVFQKLPSTGISIAVTLLSLISFTTGAWVFRRAKRTLFDYA